MEAREVMASGIQLPRGEERCFIFIAAVSTGAKSHLESLKFDHRCLYPRTRRRWPTKWYPGRTLSAWQTS